MAEDVANYLRWSAMINLIASVTVPEDVAAEKARMYASGLGMIAQDMADGG